MVEKEIGDVIQNRETYQLFIENLPENVQLRFPSKTSASGSYGVCTIVWDVERDLIVVVPYIHKKFRQKREQGIRENPAALARICMLAETGLDIRDEDPKQIGTIFYDDDSDSLFQGNFFPKYTMLVTSFKGVLRTSDEVLSEKNLQPIWVRRSLLEDIFEKTFVSLTGKVYGHSQLYAYERFQEYFELNYKL